MELGQKNQEKPAPDIGQAKSKDFKKTAGLMIFESAMEFAFYIAVPLLVFLYFGRRLDASHHTKIYEILAVLLGILTSATIIGKRINQIKRMLK